jgi:hypothetical protein
MTASSQQTILQACSLLFLFRAIGSAETDELRELLEAQLIRLIGDLVPINGGKVRLVADAGAQRIDSARREVTVPLAVRGVIAGSITAEFPPHEVDHLAEHADTLAAVATLGAIALETVREVETLNTEKALLLERLGAANHGIVGESPSLRKLLQMVHALEPRTRRC